MRLPFREARCAPARCRCFRECFGWCRAATTCARRARDLRGWQPGCLHLGCGYTSSSDPPPYRCGCGPPGEVRRRLLLLRGSSDASWSDRPRRHSFADLRIERHHPAISPRRAGLQRPVPGVPVQGGSLRSHSIGRRGIGCLLRRPRSGGAAMFDRLWPSASPIQNRPFLWPDSSASEFGRHLDLSWRPQRRSKNGQCPGRWQHSRSWRRRSWPSRPVPVPRVGDVVWRDPTQQKNRRSHRPRLGSRPQRSNAAPHHRQTCQPRNAAEVASSPGETERSGRRQRRRFGSWPGQRFAQLTLLFASVIALEGPRCVKQELMVPGLKCRFRRRASTLLVPRQRFVPRSGRTCVPSLCGVRVSTRSPGPSAGVVSSRVRHAEQNAGPMTGRDVHSDELSPISGSKKHIRRVTHSSLSSCAERTIRAFLAVGSEYRWPHVRRNRAHVTHSRLRHCVFDQGPRGPKLSGSVPVNVVYQTDGHE